MRWGRIVFAAIAATVFNALYGMLTCGWFFKWVYALAPIEVWKPESLQTGQFWAIANIGSFILYIILAIVFGWIYKALPSKCSSCRGASFGLIVWLVGLLPGMFYMYLFTVIAPTVLIYWTVSGLVSTLLTGMIISWIYGSAESEYSCCCG